MGTPLSTEEGSPVDERSSTCGKETVLAHNANKLAKTTKNAFPWDNLPFELRKQIFEELRDQEDDYFKYRMGMPALIVALRCCPTSYDHALQFFDKSNLSLEFHSRSYRRFPLHDRYKMNNHEASRIQDVTLHFS